jgi:hypothetical protein
MEIGFLALRGNLRSGRKIVLMKCGRDSASTGNNRRQERASEMGRTER